MGAITHEAGVPGGDVGAIQIADSFALVDVRQEVADRVLNALEASPRGASVRVSWASEAGSVVVTVDDTGAGMSEAVAAPPPPGVWMKRSSPLDLSSLWTHSMKPFLSSSVISIPSTLGFERKPE